MNIEKEINALQAQIEILKEKQKQEKADSDRRKKFSRITYGQLYIRDNDPRFIAMVIEVGVNESDDLFPKQNDKWGFVYDDGTGEVFDSKNDMRQFFINHNFAYYGKNKSFSTK
jgi:hypothetical protein